jgi:hypothetical protein
MADLWTTILGWVNAESEHYIYAEIPGEGATPLVPMKS